MCVLKKVLLPLLFLSFSSALFAQVSLGVRAGISLPKINISDDDDYGYYNEFDFPVLMGGVAGAVCEIKLHQNFAIQPELMFVQKGSKVEFPDYYYYYYYYGGGNETEIRLNYMEVPVLAKGIIGNETLSGYAVLGPSFGYAISGYIDQGGEKDTIDGDDWDSFKRFEFGANFGAGAGLQIGESGQAFVDLRYLLGFTNIAEDSDGTIRNRGFSLTVGFMKSLK
ncbi:MAG: porin family protein [Bacteroidota bacterium]